MFCVNIYIYPKAASKWRASSNKYLPVKQQKIAVSYGCRRRYCAFKCGRQSLKCNMRNFKKVHDLLFQDLRITLWWIVEDTDVVYNIITA